MQVIKLMDHRVVALVVNHSCRSAAMSWHLQFSRVQIKSREPQNRSILQCLSHGKWVERQPFYCFSRKESVKGPKLCFAQLLSTYVASTLAIEVCRRYFFPLKTPATATSRFIQIPQKTAVSLNDSGFHRFLQNCTIMRHEGLITCKTIQSFSTSSVERRSLKHM